MWGKLASLYQRANESFGRHGIIWAVVLFGLPFVALGSLVVILTTTLHWYWHWFGWLGVLFAVLVSWVLLGTILLIIRYSFEPAWLPPIRRDPHIEEKPRDLSEIKDAIRQCRGLIASEAMRLESGPDFYSAIQANYFYYKLRPFLSEDFRKRMLPRGRHLIAEMPGTVIPTDARLLADELDRIEAELGLG